ncbi:transcriptional regulator, TetR family [Pseudomonas sp. NFIX10]|uniref:TetR/AcrR family transcriptional regulator n=1 Tax=Pseudomonas TaxID=286 RepID=UPI000871B035|nr:MULTISPECIES: TetR/AcrR family transcriptional regulator [unclassified Pseudomonas]SCW99076.1 transcriptional regulator, TetR family [Pseudomonas sp. NFACC56-3]SFB01268.1 transcriptional regulator, TetR family [Pseudomonas sp. NFIX10]SFE54659.1 transcriptional regulator, TetR family [Pseudomonas sp. NFACC06-1]SFK87663.1 transcriptional regulator, TetR family [Pseudomonas sp. NFACC52]
MARPTQFDRDVVLQRASRIFAQHGYEGTSTEDLLKAMGVGRQSLYNAFGDKWQLYLEVLRQYTSESVGDQLRTLNSVASPVDGIKALLLRMVNDAASDPAPSCLGISAICEFGRANSEVAMISDIASRTLAAAISARVTEAQRAGTLSKSTRPDDLASFILATLSGIKVAARAGASRATLEGIAKTALRCIS